MKSNKIVLFDIDYTLFDTAYFRESDLKKHSLYEEVNGVLEKLSKISDLGIFSQGEYDFQRKKLHKTSIEKYFTKENVHIFAEKDSNLKDVLKKYKEKKVFIVDDKLPVLYGAKSLLPSISTIWVKRGFYAENQKEIEGFSPDITVLNLRDIIAFIERS